jgi:hypothetical protein
MVPLLSQRKYIWLPALRIRLTKALARCMVLFAIDLATRKVETLGVRMRPIRAPFDANSPQICPPTVPLGTRIPLLTA